ncbi:MAG: GTPase Era [Silvanigrellaceae bacterium]|nr:GTPase Era [Silvanigrellaceae bacterium]
MIKKCGYVALLGRPNAGKSTLLNALIGSKITIVSNKPQTTRNKILGIFTQEDSQMLFLDTPGIHSTQSLNQLNKLMNKTAWSALKDADIACYLVDILQGWQEEDEKWLEGILGKFEKKLLLLVTKVDKIKLFEVEEKFNTIVERFEASLSKLKTAGLRYELIGNHPYLASAKRPEDVQALRALISSHLPEGPWLFADDDITDKSQKFVCAEMIREQLFRQLNREIPYKCAVVVDFFQHKANNTSISATIIVEKESHRAIILGKGGSQIKSIGSDARLTLEKHLDRKVFLELFVKVQQGWTENNSMLQEFANLQRIEE